MNLCNRLRPFLPRGWLDWAYIALVSIAFTLLIITASNCSKMEQSSHAIVEECKPICCPNPVFGIKTSDGECICNMQIEYRK